MPETTPVLTPATPATWPMSHHAQAEAPWLTRCESCGAEWLDASFIQPTHPENGCRWSGVTLGELIHAKPALFPPDHIFRTADEIARAVADEIKDRIKVTGERRFTLKPGERYQAPCLRVGLMEEREIDWVTIRAMVRDLAAELPKTCAEWLDQSAATPGAEASHFSDQHNPVRLRVVRSYEPLRDRFLVRVDAMVVL